MRAKLIDKYGFEKIIKIPNKVRLIHYYTFEGYVDFELFDLKGKLPIFKQTGESNHRAIKVTK